jgi:hypothetical protein
MRARRPCHRCRLVTGVALSPVSPCRPCHPFQSWHPCQSCQTSSTVDTSSMRRPGRSGKTLRRGTRSTHRASSRRAARPARPPTAPVGGSSRFARDPFSAGSRANEAKMRRTVHSPRRSMNDPVLWRSTRSPGGTILDGRAMISGCVLSLDNDPISPLSMLISPASTSRGSTHSHGSRP